MQHPSRWDLPKGHLDSGESKQQAALRELREETGILASDIWIDNQFVFENRYWVTYKKNGKSQYKELTIYLGFLVQDKPIQTTEHEGFQWTDWLPPHQIQSETIDPLLEKVWQYLETRPEWPG